VIADPGRHQVTVVAAKNGTFYGQAMTAGHLYAVAGNGKFGYAPSGVPATTAKLGGVQNVAVDGADNLVIADWGHNLQDLTRWARVQVVAAKSGTFYGQAMTVGDIYTVAGSGPLRGSQANGHPATQAAIGEYVGQVTVDQAGNLLVASPPLNRVWLVAATSGRFYGQAMAKGDIYTVAGNGGRAFSGDGGGHQGHAGRPLGRHGGPRWQPGDRRPGQRPGADGRRRDRHVLRAGDDKGRHLHRGRQRRVLLLRGRRPGHPRRARLPGGCRGGRPGQPGDRRQHTDPAGHRMILRSGWSGGRRDAQRGGRRLASGARASRQSSVK